MPKQKVFVVHVGMNKQWLSLVVFLVVMLLRHFELQLSHSPLSNSYYTSLKAFCIFLLLPSYFSWRCIWLLWIPLPSVSVPPSPVHHWSTVLPLLSLWQQRVYCCYCWRAWAPGPFLTLSALLLVGKTWRRLLCVDSLCLTSKRPFKDHTWRTRTLAPSGRSTLEKSLTPDLER